MTLTVLGLLGSAALAALAGVLLVIAWRRAARAERDELEAQARARARSGESVRLLDRDDWGLRWWE